jgi:succinate dehydrogenase / fumarate reductase membrane anchor subunit
MNDLRTPLAKAKGLGSAKEGISHWWRQRLTALLLLPLTLWFGFAVASIPEASHASLTAWISSPMVTVALVLLILTVFYHAQLGLQVIIEDYVSTHWRRTSAIILVSFLCLLLAVIGVIAVLRIALGG